MWSNKGRWVAYLRVAAQGVVCLGPPSMGIGGKGWKARQGGRGRRWGLREEGNEEAIRFRTCLYTLRRNSKSAS